jgi:FtsP/CotA-like multicopper oxidase with cupredoxin domain
MLFFSFFTTAATARERTYFIAADEVLWNYLPQGKDMVQIDRPLPPYLGSVIGLRLHKAVYREYTDKSFTHLKPRSPDEQYLGLLGPVIRAEVGDTIVVVFKNNTHLHLSIHPHGVFYAKSDEGAKYSDNTDQKRRLDNAVAPGDTFTYHWSVPERSGPGPMDASSIVWMYHSHTDELHDVESGLIGPMIITRKGSAKPDGSPKDVDREVIAAFLEMEEFRSPYLDQNVAQFAKQPKKVNKTSGPFILSSDLYTVNGYLFGNGPLMRMRQGQRVRWYVFTGTSGFDFHTPHWHGNTVLFNGQRTDVVPISPMSMVVADMIPDDPGIWMLHCHVDLHMEAGMETRYEVLP